MTITQSVAPGRPAKPLIAGLLVAALGGAPQAAAQDDSDAASRGERIEALQQEIDKQRKALEQARERRSTTQQELEALRGNLEDLRKDIDALERQLEQASADGGDG